MFASTFFKNLLDAFRAGILGDQLSPKDLQTALDELDQMIRFLVDYNNDTKKITIEDIYKNLYTNWDVVLSNDIFALYLLADQNETILELIRHAKRQSQNKKVVKKKNFWDLFS